MYQPVLLKDRPRNTRILLAGVIPALVGAVAGVLIGSSLAGYWLVAVLAALGGVLAGFEHEDGWGGADRGLLGGLLYGIGLLLAHAIAGTHAKVSLGGFPPLFAVVTAIVGMFLGALGGRIGRIALRRPSAATASAPPAEVAMAAAAGDLGAPAPAPAATATATADLAQAAAAPAADLAVATPAMTADLSARDVQA
jgi:hypothetical protein